jgi:ubiquitin C-terminal hydrolase
LSKHSYDIFIYISFKEIIRKINDKDSKTKYVNNRAFMSITNELSRGSAFEHLFSGEQNDPHELLAYLLDKLHNAKSSIVPIDIPDNIDNLDIYYRLYLTQFKARYENDYSYFVKNLYYYILNCIKCSKCDHKSYNLTPNDILCVAIPDIKDIQNAQLQTSDDKKTNIITIYDCLNEMFKIDNITYKCENCSNCEGNLMEKKILSKPKTLIIKLKRYTNSQFGNRMVKINKRTTHIY